MTDEKSTPIDPRDNEESQIAESTASHTLARSSDGGPVPSPAREADAVPGVPDAADEGVEDGTGQGDPLAGVTFDAEEAAANGEDVVSGDTGPEHPGQR
ncbi:hypothetical protein ACFFKU_00955 [Kineococcus gynurae]|uniref:Uncharacterized protein n=1 Tax=Kineococcus gynurae TaxID=452979 RepID=A0ABV5LPU7_9ACTN